MKSRTTEKHSLGHRHRAAGSGCRRRLHSLPTTANSGSSQNYQKSHHEKNPSRTRHPNQASSSSLVSSSRWQASGRRLGRAVEGRADEAESDGTKTCILQLFFSCAFDRTFQSAAASSTKQLDLTALTIQCAKVVVG